ncbi:MAG: ABC transporter substrate-binding protein [Gammaproteobacteria bacterium]|nr:ABC transporter substrate-binding protein [Gammaproteobacteria bacterium]
MEHSFIENLKRLFCERKIDRREFLRTSTLLGLSASAAYAFVGKVTGESFIPSAQAQDMPKGGTIRIAMRVQELKNPHTYSWEQSDITRQVCEHLTRTGHDNVTRPNLLEKWEVSDDLKTWTLSVRQDVKWHSGRSFTADDVIWNLQHVLDPATGSSVMGLMAGYLLQEFDTGEKDDEGNPVMSQRLWDANAIEKIDDHTIRLNCKEPQLAVPEHLFHYPLHILDPEENGEFGPGSNGTGPFELTEHSVGESAIIVARPDYWGEGPYAEKIHYVDLGDESGAYLSALASQQVHGIREMDIASIDTAGTLPHIQVYEAVTAQTGVARVKVDQEPFTDPRVRKAMRLAIDSKRVFELAHRARGAEAQHHHVAPIHPEYADIPHLDRDVEAAKILLAEAGYPNGIDVEIAAKPNPEWELAAVQEMVQQWKDAGIRVSINVMPGAAFWDVWDKVPFGFTEWTHRPLGVMVLALAYRSGAVWNESGYANPEFDALLTKAEGLADPTERSVVMAEIETLMQEDGPLVQPLWRAVFGAFDKKVRGFEMHPTSYIFAEQLAIEA